MIEKMNSGLTGNNTIAGSGKLIMQGVALLIEPSRFKRHSALCASWLLALVVVLVMVLFIGIGSSSGETLYVDDDAADGGDGSQGSPFNRIQDAVNASEVSCNSQNYVFL